MPVWKIKFGKERRLKRSECALQFFLKENVCHNGNWKMKINLFVAMQMLLLSMWLLDSVVFPFLDMEASALQLHEYILKGSDTPVNYRINYCMRGKKKQKEDKKKIPSLGS